MVVLPGQRKKAVVAVKKGKTVEKDEEEVEEDDGAEGMIVAVPAGVKRVSTASP